MTTNAQSSSTLTRIKVENTGSLQLEVRDIQLVYRPDIDGLRAIAILLVLAFHAFPSLCPSGFIGVDVFFVISGFLITQILIKSDPADKSALLTFYSRRVRRIFPALIAVLLSVSVYGYFTLLPNDFSLLIKYVAAGSSFVSNIVAWQNSGYFNKSTELAPLVHLWSLAIEEQFYIFWPVVFLALRNRLPFNYLKHSVVILLLLSLLLCVIVTFKDQTQAYYSPFVRAWELLTGAWLAHKSFKSGKLFPTEGLKAFFITIVAVAGLVGSSFYIDKAAFPGVWALMPISAAALIVAYAQISWIGRFLSMPVMVYIGRISYPLYLWHWPLLAYLRIENPNPYWIDKLFALALSFLLACITFHFLEKPIQARKIRLTNPILIAVMLVIFAGSFAMHSFGVVNRVLNPVQQKLTVEYDPRPDYRFSRCFLDSAIQTSKEFKPECAEQALLGQKKILLWGDSLSAQLYPGLNALREKHSFAITQRTASSCPPSVTARYHERGNCDEINSSTVEYLKGKRFDIALLNGRWGNDAKSQIRDLVSFLRMQGINNIYIFGPTPDWVPDIRHILMKSALKTGKFPEFMEPPSATWGTTKNEAERLRKISGELGIGYVSPLDIFCNGDKCRVKVSDEIPEGLIASDHDHMTAKASTFFFKDLRASYIFGK